MWLVCGRCVVVRWSVYGRDFSADKIVNQGNRLQIHRRSLEITYGSLKLPMLHDCAKSFC